MRAGCRPTASQRGQQAGTVAAGQHGRRCRRQGRTAHFRLDPLQGGRDGGGQEMVGQGAVLLAGNGLEHRVGRDRPAAHRPPGEERRRCR